MVDNDMIGVHLTTGGTVQRKQCCESGSGWIGGTIFADPDPYAFKPNVKPKQYLFQASIYRTAVLNIENTDIMTRGRTM